MPDSRLDYLFLRYYEKNITEEERSELMAMLLQEENRGQINDLIDQIIRESHAEFHLSEQTADDILSSIFTASASINSHANSHFNKEAIPVLDNVNVKRMPVWLRGLVAASVGVMLVYGGYRLNNTKQLKVAPPIVLHSVYGEDVVPGSNKASLQLANGQTVDLARVASGNLAEQPGTQVDKAKGELIYNATFTHSVPVSFNTLTTPLGGQYKVMLPDGSKAWLNAGSRLKYPTSFTGSRREVEMCGEVYFEIYQNKKMPFIVHLNDKNGRKKDMEITVLGTHFNICSYRDEPTIQTTLLEGSVQIKKGELTKILAPGQQAEVPVDAADHQIAVKNVDTESVIAWKEGRFEFNGNVKDIMRQISRWYDLQVVYEGNVGNKGFAGAISRKNNVSEVLKMLELTGGIQFKIEDRKITVKSTD